MPIRINLCEADNSHLEEIINLYDGYWKDGTIHGPTSDFTTFVRNCLKTGSGTYAIHSPAGTHRVALSPRFYVAYAPSSFAGRGGFLGFCAIQERLQLTLYPTEYDGPPYELEIPWFYVSKSDPNLVAGIAEAMLRTLIKKEAVPPHANVVWAYSFCIKPGEAWWPVCLSQAGFAKVDKEFGVCEPDGDLECVVNAFRLDLSNA